MIAAVAVALVMAPRNAPATQERKISIRILSLYRMTRLWALSIRGVLVSPAPMTNMATNMTTFVLMKPPKASAGVLMPVRISARMMPVEMTENGTLPDTKAMIVTSRMTNVISNGLIWVVLLWITSTLQMQSSGKGV